jgi:hypothetical protein
LPQSNSPFDAHNPSKVRMASTSCKSRQMGSGPMSNEGENRSRAYRKFGMVRHTFPDFTPTEKAFLVGFVVSGPVAAIFAGKSMRGSDRAIVGFCGCIMSPVLGYWMRYEPAAFLQFLLFPITGYSPKWPRIVLMCVRAFGYVAVFGALSSLSMILLPASWTKSPTVGLVLLAITVGITVFVLQKRSRT